MANNVTIGGKTYDLSNQSDRADARTANPNLIIDASSAYNPGTGQQQNASSGSSPSPGTPAAPTNANSTQLAAGIQGLLGAAASGNKDAINEQIREWNQSFGLDTQKFQDDIRRFNENLQISQSGLTGTYQGAPTQAALLQQANMAAQSAGLTGMYQQPGVAGPGVPTLAAQQQAYAQQLGLINQAATLQANPFRQQQALGQMGQLLGGGGVAGFSAPNTVAGVGVAGGNTQGGMGYLQQMIDDIRDPSANQASMSQVLQGIPTPNKLNSNEFLRAAPSTQNMVLQGMTEKYGIQPEDALAQIKATLPGFQAPTLTGTVKR